MAEPIRVQQDYDYRHCLACHAAWHSMERPKHRPDCPALSHPEQVIYE